MQSQLFSVGTEGEWAFGSQIAAGPPSIADEPTRVSFARCHNASILACSRLAVGAAFAAKFPLRSSLDAVQVYLGWKTRMKFMSYAYRFISNFILLALVYYSLNFLDKYHQRAIVAILVLIYSAMRAVSALRSFYFYQRIEKLEVDVRRIGALPNEAAAAAAQRKAVVAEVGGLRQAGEMKSYIDLLFLALIVLLCVSRIVTD
jgi:hypothetical protein